MAAPITRDAADIITANAFLSVHDRFAFIAAQYSDNVAVTTTQQSISYTKAQERTDRLAYGLISLGIQKGDRVGVFMDRSLDFPLVLLAILKAGAVFVPLDPSYPQARLEKMIELSRPALVICDDLLTSQISATVKIATVAAMEEKEAETATLPVTDRNDPAYIMFTSGSTGTPKAVMVPHRGILRLVINPNYIQLGPNEIIPQLSITSFDASTFEIWGALLNGGALAIPAAGKLSVSEVGEFLQASRATIGVFSTGFFHLIVDEHPEILANLQQVLIGGDVLSSAHVKRLSAIAPGMRIVNGYGPTEATTFALCYTAPDIKLIPDPLPIGHAINETSIFILDAQMMPVDAGVEGELYIGGDGLALGYMGNEVETSARFIRNPDASHPDKILYKTGDVVRLDKNGLVMFMGRADQQVKIRGFRIELGEIEAKLRDHELVRDAIVVARQNEKLAADKTLAAYVILSQKDDNWQERLQNYLAGTLPSFMMPSDWVTLEKFPLGPTGKVDRKAIAAMPIHSARPKTIMRPVACAPLTGTEALICDLCSEILDVSDISAEDNFMGLGGDSLKAARLASRLSTTANVTLKLGDILSSDKLRDIADRIDEMNSTSVQATIEQLRPSPLSRTEFPLSFAQEQLWLIYLALPQSAAYNEPNLVCMPVAIQPQILANALSALAERHPILRTTYGIKDGVPFQRINDNLSITFNAHEKITQEEFDEYAALDIAQPFDLENGPIARARYVIFNDGSAKLVLVIHHIAFDGISLFNTLLPELQKLCRDSKLPAPALRYADFAEWQRRTATPETLEQILRYWEERLTGMEPVSLPFRIDTVRRTEGRSHAFLIPVALAAKIRDLAKREHVSLFAVTASALISVLHRYTYQDDIAIGFVHAARPSSALDGVVGGFVNTFALRTKIKHNASFRSVLRDVWSSIRDAQDHDAPYEVVVARMAQKLQLRGRPLLDVLISYDPPCPQMTDGWTTDHLAFKKYDPKFPMSLELGDASDGAIYGRIEYSTSFIPADAVQRLAEHFCAVLDTAANDAALPIERMDILSSPETKQLADGQPQDLLQIRYNFVGDMLEQAVRMRPDREALVFGAQRLTYTELHCIVQEKAGALRALGIGQKKPAALLFKDPLQRCIAAWSVWAAGGAIAPIDPEYPDERIYDYLTQMGSVTVLTEPEFLPKLAAYEALAFDSLIAGDALPITRGSPEDMAYIIFTSGSTGRPKGVMISHRNACSMVSAHIEALGCDEDMLSLQMAGPSFDAYVSELMFTCANAGTLVVAERHVLLPGKELVDLMARKKINDAFLTPVLLACLTPSDFPSLKTITCAGDFCPPDLASRWVNAGVRFIHAYGPAECTVCATLAVINKPRMDFLPLGKALPGYKLYLIDPWGNQAPLGAIGEICIGGRGVGMGYLGGSSTAETRFVPDTFSSEPDMRLYRTGDLGRFNKSGELEFMGRNDAQIKIRGMRVELGEIEAVILENPEILSAIVLSVSQGTNAADPALGAVIAFRTPPAAEWRTVLAKQLRNRLPAHMVPTYFSCVDNMPVTANGKIDRRRLLPFTTEDRMASASKNTGTIPLTPNEHAVFCIWRNVFPDVQEDTAADFFELGGHSLLAAKLVALFNEHFGTTMPMRVLFENPTIAGMAEWLQQGNRTRQAQTAPLADAMCEMALPSKIFKRHTGDILLTGASGFVGHHLLWQLLDSTDDDIYCLARGNDREIHDLLVKKISAAGCVKPNWQERLHVISSDLASPDFLTGSDEAILRTREFRAIYHCGARVHSLYPYTTTRSANVEATRCLIELAARCGADFNHISTVGVFENAERSRSGLITEDEMPLGPPPIESGYNCSKWVAEMLVRRAAEKGLTTRIFRLGRVAWSNSTGLWNENDFLYRLLQGCLQLGAAPDWQLDFRVIPVDFLARAVVAVSETASTQNETYHLVGNTVLHWQGLNNALRQRQDGLQLLSHADWWRMLTMANGAGQDNALSALIERLDPASGISELRPPDFQTQRTAAVLKDIGLDEPCADIEKCRFHC